MFNNEQNKELYKPVSEEELLKVMKSFKNDKCPGRYGWTIKIFLHFFDLVTKDLLSMVEESRMSGKIHQYILSTYIALIPKKNPFPSWILDQYPFAI